MIFNSLVFLYLFLPVVYFVFWRLQSKKQRYIWLTISGYVFYSFWNYKFCALMALSTVVSYLAGLGFLRWHHPRRRRLCLIVPVSFDLALLGFFKYADLGISTFNSTIGRSIHAAPWPLLHVILPVGISFYTFHTITYIVDSYRGNIVPTRNLFEFSCYVSFFAQLVAGPIVRFREIEGDLDHIDKPNQTELLEQGWSFFLVGLSKKVILADSIAAIVNPALQQYQSLSTAGVWLCMIGYAYQIYFDFSGYSDMAVGLGRMFGLRLPQNFNSPYRALDVSDFWRRWHISLSSVLRDYLYIPMGGNRGAAWKTGRNLMITMLLGGLWHGASWTFVFWGAYHGALLLANRALKTSIDAFPNWIRRTGTFVLVIVGWVFFRSQSFAMAGSLVGRMFWWRDGFPMTGAVTLTALLLIAAGFSHFGRNGWEWRPTSRVVLASLFIVCLIFIYGGNQSPFLYFQF